MLSVFNRNELPTYADRVFDILCDYALLCVVEFIVTVEFSIIPFLLQLVGRQAGLFYDWLLCYHLVLFLSWHEICIPSQCVAVIENWN